MKPADFFAKTVATFLGVGYLPFIPGTFGSVAGLAVYSLIKWNTALYLVSVAVVILLGFLSCGRAEKAFGIKDPKYAVIDEVAGMLISLMFIPCDIKWIIIGFFLFRLLDTLKPFPANRFQKMHGSLGIMGDDVVAGIYCNIVLQAVFRLASYIGS